MTTLSSRQRRHIVETLRRELELYGGIPPLHKRHRARVSAQLAEKYGVTVKEVDGLWKAWLEKRRIEGERFQQAKWRERIAAGLTPSTSSQGPTTASRLVSGSS